MADVSQFEEEAPEAEAAEEAVPDTKFSNTTNKDAVARRRRIEEVVEGKRTKTYGGDYDFDLDD